MELHQVVFQRGDSYSPHMGNIRHTLSLGTQSLFLKVGALRGDIDQCGTIRQPRGGNFECV